MTPILLLALAMSPAEVDRLLSEGRQLAANPLQRMEQRIASEPDNAAIRLQLLAAYTENASTAGVETAKGARAEHILWFIRYQPDNPVLTHRTGVAQLHCAGDELADPGAAEKAKDLWVAQAQKAPQLNAVAANYIHFCDLETALKLKPESSHYADAALGLTGLDYANSDPAASDPGLRNSPGAERARAWMAETLDPKALHRFLYNAALLRSQERLDWDYTAFAAPLLEKARATSPGAVELWAVKAEAPASGARPPATVFVEGLIPETPGGPYTVLIDPEGRVAKVAGSGDGEALRQLTFRPRLVQGKPAYVVTTTGTKP